MKTLVLNNDYLDFLKSSMFWCGFMTTLLLVIVLGSLQMENAFSIMSFSRQEIVDGIDDWTLFNVPLGTGFKIATENGNFRILEYEDSFSSCRKARYFDSVQYHFHPPDIKSVSYLSDGNTLNVTLWLSSTYRNPAANASAWLSQDVRDSPWYRTNYLVSVIVQGAYDLEGPDYALGYSWDALNNTWSRTVAEVSPSGDIVNLEAKNGYDIFLNGNNSRNHINFSLDLSRLNYPQQYALVFSAFDYFVKDGRVCALVDITSRVHIPPPSFDLSATPSSIELRPGEEKNIKLELQSQSDIQAQVHFALDRNAISPQEIIPELTADEISIAPYGLVASNLKVHALDGIDTGSYTLPIVASLDIETVATTRRASEFIANLQSENLNETSYFTITVLPPLTMEQNLDLFLKQWILPVSGIWTFLAGVGAVIVPLIIRIYRKKNRRE